MAISRYWLVLTASLALLGSQVHGQGKPPAKPTTNGQKNAGPRKTVPVKAPPKTTPGVRGMFDEAQKLYQAEKYQEAMIAYDRILRRYPGHEPSVIQYAKTLYRLDRLPEAYQYFTRTNLAALDVDTSYEYGLSHFWMRQYQPAFNAFKRVPEGHALSDLSNYYGGISALKMQRLVEAEDMMEKAVVLPDKLAKSRKLYLKHIQDLKLMYEKRGLDEEKAREKAKLDGTGQPQAQNPAATPTPAPTPVPSGKYEHQGFQALIPAAYLGVKYKEQLNDKHGYAEETVRIRNSYFQFIGGPLLPLPLIISKKQAAFGLELSGRIEEQKVDGEENRNVRTDDLEDVQRIQTSKTNNKITKYTSYYVRPWFEFPTASPLWLSVGGKFSQRFPDFKRVNRSTTRSGFLMGAGKINDSFTGIGTYSFAEILGNKDQRLQSISTTDGILDWQINKFLLNEFELTYEYDNYFDETLDGPSSITTGSSDLAVFLPLGFMTGINLSLQYQEGYLIHDLPNYTDVSADGTTYAGKIYLRAAPIKWFSAEIYQLVQKTDWVVDPEEAQDSFEANVVDYSQEFQASASLNLLF